MATQSWDDFIAAVGRNTPEDRIIGMIYGHALGDAVGLQTEFKFKRDGHPITFPLDRPVRDFPMNDWTDDTDHLIIVMQSMIANGFKLAPLDIAARLKAWTHSGFPELGDTSGAGLGGTMSMVIKHAYFMTRPEVAAATIWNNSGKKLASNGILMRTSIVGALRKPPAEIASWADALCSLTHADPRCVAACVVQSLVINGLIYERPTSADDIDRLLGAALDVAQSHLTEEKPMIFAGARHQPTPASYHDPRFNTRADEFAHWVGLGYAGDLAALELDEQVRIGFVLKCLACSAYVLRMIALTLRHGKRISFKKLIGLLAAECGDADTNCAVAGATLGAYLGYHALPADWIAALPNRTWLNEIIVAYIAALRTYPSKEGVVTSRAAAVALVKDGSCSSIGALAISTFGSSC